MRIAPALCAGAVLSACVTDPTVTRDTPYEGNVAPLDYKRVSGVRQARSETRELMGAVAVGLVGGQAAAQAAATAGQGVAGSSGLECRVANEWTK